jgi:hypothetical protein
MTLFSKDKDSSDASVKQQQVIINCNHCNITPLEFNFAQVTYPNGYGETAHYNYSASAINANVLRVKTFYCLDCKTEIKAIRRQG